MWQDVTSASTCFGCTGCINLAVLSVLSRQSLRPSVSTFWTMPWTRASVLTCLTKARILLPFWIFWSLFSSLFIPFHPFSLFLFFSLFLCISLSFWQMNSFLLLSFRHIESEDWSRRLKNLFWSVLSIGGPRMPRFLLLCRSCSHCSHCSHGAKLSKAQLRQIWSRSDQPISSFLRKRGTDLAGTMAAFSPMVKLALEKAIPSWVMFTMRQETAQPRRFRT